MRPVFDLLQTSQAPGALRCEVRLRYVSRDADVLLASCAFGLSRGPHLVRVLKLVSDCRSCATRGAAPGVTGQGSGVARRWVERRAKHVPERAGPGLDEPLGRRENLSFRPQHTRVHTKARMLVAAVRSDQAARVKSESSALHVAWERPHDAQGEQGRRPLGQRPALGEGRDAAIAASLEGDKQRRAARCGARTPIGTSAEAEV